MKAGTSPLVFGDQHDFYGYENICFSSTQDIIVAVGRAGGNKVRINNYQSALYGEKVIGSCRGDWKFEVKEENDKFLYVFIRICALVADECGLEDIGGMDLMIYTGAVEDEFVGWKEGLYASVYAAMLAVITKNKPIESKAIHAVLKAIGAIDQEITVRPQLTSYECGSLTQHNGAV